MLHSGMYSVGDILVTNPRVTDVAFIYAQVEFCTSSPYVDVLC